MDELVNFATYAASDHSCRSSDGRDDLSSDHLGLLLLAFLDSIVTSAKISCGVNEVDVEVAIIILFKVNGVEILASDTNVGNLKLRKKLFKNSLIFRSDLFWCSGLLSCCLSW